MRKNAFHQRFQLPFDRKFQSAEETIAMATMYSANHMDGITAMISMTESGRTPLMMSRLSSGLPILHFLAMKVRLIVQPYTVV